MKNATATNDEDVVLPCFSKLTDYHLFKYVRMQGVKDAYLTNTYNLACIRAVARERSTKKQYAIVREFITIPLKQIKATTPDQVFANFVAALPEYFESLYNSD